VPGVVGILHARGPTLSYLYHIDVFPSVAAVFGLLDPEHEDTTLL